MKQQLRRSGRDGRQASPPLAALTCLERDSAFQRRLLDSSPPSKHGRIRGCYFAATAQAIIIGPYHLLARQLVRADERCAAAAMAG